MDVIQNILIRVKKFETACLKDLSSKDILKSDEKIASARPEKFIFLWLQWRAPWPLVLCGPEKQGSLFQIDASFGWISPPVLDLV